MDSHSDDQIVREVLNGCKEAYAVLVDRYKGLVHGLAFRLVRDPDIAEEVTQETFVTAYLRMDRLARPERFAAWVAMIARNGAMTALRKRGRSPQSLDALSEQGFDAAVDPVAPGTEEEQERQLAALRYAVARLPPPYREVIELRYTEGFSCERIASFLDITVSAAKVRLHRARKRVLAILRKEGWVR